MDNYKIGRVIQTLMSLQSGQNNSVPELMKLNNCSRRTIFRDLKEIQKVGIEYKYDRDNKSYVIQDDLMLRPPNLSYKEAVILLLLVKKAKSQIHIPCEKTAMIAALKIENSLSPPVRKYCRQVLQNISVGSLFNVESNGFGDMFFFILAALNNKVVISFSYCLNNGLKSDVTLNPYHLHYCNNKWYLIGKSHYHKKVMHFPLTSIKELELIEEVYEDKKTVDINKYIGNAWQIESDGRLYKIKLRLSSEIAREAESIKWHKTQSVVKQDDGSVILEFRVNGLEEIASWILSHGENVTVLSPKVLREKIISKADNIMELYSQGTG